jgi:hypothetical protein
LRSDLNQRIHENAIKFLSSYFRKPDPLTIPWGDVFILWYCDIVISRYYKYNVKSSQVNFCANYIFTISVVIKFVLCIMILYYYVCTVYHKFISKSDELPNKVWNEKKMKSSKFTVMKLTPLQCTSICVVATKMKSRYHLCFAFLSKRWIYQHT